MRPTNGYFLAKKTLFSEFPHSDGASQRDSHLRKTLQIWTTRRVFVRQPSMKASPSGPTA